MSDELQSAKDDLAFLRGVTSENAQFMACQGAMLIAVGVIFGIVNLCYWALASKLIRLHGYWEQAPWIAGVVILLAVMLVLKSRMPGTAGAAGRAFGAASGGVGIGISAAAIALVAASGQFEVPLLVARVFPIVLFTLYGAAWCVAYAVRQRPWFAFVAAACFAGAIACGFLVKRPEEWLVLAGGLIFLVALPGYVILRQSRD